MTGVPDGGAMTAAREAAWSALAPPSWNVAQTSAVLQSRPSRLTVDSEAVQQGLARTDEELIALAARRAQWRKVVVGLTALFLLTEAVLAYTAWEGLRVAAKERKYEPNYSQLKIVLGFCYYAVWTYAVKSCADICLSDCAGIVPVLQKESIRKLLSSLAGYVPGMWCLALFLVWDGLPKEQRRDALNRQVSLAGCLQFAVLAIALSLLATWMRDRASASAIRSRAQETLLAATGLLDGCEASVHRMRKVPFHADELMDQDDGKFKDCPICACEFGMDLPIVGTRCNHLFHEECLAVWCKARHVCPLCRCDLREGAFLEV